jgi:hypothetical protein
VPLASSAERILSPISTDAAMGFSVNIGTRALYRSGTMAPTPTNPILRGLEDMFTDSHHKSASSICESENVPIFF